ncbi:hypothetical protein HPP92_018030 [Vanilla planifolia]|uniref:DNA polymerase delta subunit OB-fold domain-containing protein n=1 Tax=Vanilla planifolia TaxID=51239 RepID=A0A835QJ61_VANPL|nr:hypothetical protein HPP92_018030 [Vanilla planifolia]
MNNVLGLEEGKECIIVGTIYKHMKLKPSILDEYSKERSMVPLVKPHNFVHSDDYLILEDEIGRVRLRGCSLIAADFVTGTGLALHGMKTNEGDFLVQDFLEAGLPPQMKLPIHRRLEHVNEKTLQYLRPWLEECLALESPWHIKGDMNLKIGANGVLAVVMLDMRQVPRILHLFTTTEKLRV